MPVKRKHTFRKEEVPICAQSKEKDPILRILESVQVNEGLHNKYIKELQNQYKKIGHDAFCGMFINCLKQLIASNESQAQCANIGLKFMASFATSLVLEDMHPILETILKWVLQHVSHLTNIRSRLCHFVSLLLISLGDTPLEDNLYDEIVNYMFDRLMDSYPSVRLQAIKALERLQMPDDPDDAIVKKYIFHLSFDPSSIVRRAVVTCLGRNTYTIPIILERLWDIDEKVRRSVIVHMSNYPVRSYKTINRLTLLEQGLNDRSDSVRNIVTGLLIPQWLGSYGDDYLAFLNGFKLDLNEREIDRFRVTARLALFEIFKKTKPDSLIASLSLNADEDSNYPKCIPYEKLTIESGLFWGAVIVHFQKNELDDHLTQIIPELTVFCRYVQTYNDNIFNGEKDEHDILISQSILFGLIEILLTFDYGEEVGRHSLRTLVIHLLKTNPCNENIIKSLITIFEKLIPNCDDRLQLYTDLIHCLVDQDILTFILNSYDPIFIESLEDDEKVLVSTIKLKLYELKEEARQYVKMKNDTKVARISEQITTLQEQLLDIVIPSISSGSNYLHITKEVQIKALQLTFNGISSRVVAKLNPAMCQLYTNFIRPKIESNDIDIKNWALKCGATCGLLHEQLAKDIFSALTEQFFNHHFSCVWTTSVSALFQLIVRYGISYFDDSIEEMYNENGNNGAKLHTTTAVINLCGHFMEECDDIDLKCAIIDGIGLLITQGLYSDEIMVSRLVLLYFNPKCETKIHQILSIFFETLIHKKHQKCLETALIRTLTVITEAPTESPLHEVKSDTVLKFIINATSPVHCKPGVNIHNNMALSLLEWMNNNNSNRKLLQIISKEIFKLEISEDTNIRKKLVEYAERLLEFPMDFKTKMNLKSFKDRMHGKSNEFSSVTNSSCELRDNDLSGDDVKTALSSSSSTKE